MITAIIPSAGPLSKAGRVEISASDAAARLGVDPSRVRVLLRDGVLPGRQVGHRWMIRSEDVARHEGRRAGAGRPLAPARAWGLLSLLEAGRASWLPAVARSQTKQLMRRLSGLDADRWRAALRARNEVLRCRAHPAAIARLLDRPDVLSTGDSEAARRGIDLIALDAIPQAYVPPDAWPILSEDLLIGERASGPNLIVLLPRAVWPFEGQSEVSLSALAADLLESAEPRAVSSGLAVLNRLASAAVGSP